MVLYEGYVNATNELNKHLLSPFIDGKVVQEDMPAYSELTRRWGLEYNGMLLHEHYFGNLKQEGRIILTVTPCLSNERNERNPTPSPDIAISHMRENP